MTSAALRADLKRLQRDIVALLDRVDHEPLAASLAGSQLGDAVDALARARDDLAQALHNGARP